MFAPAAFAASNVSVSSKSSYGAQLHGGDQGSAFFIVDDNFKAVGNKMLKRLGILDKSQKRVLSSNARPTISASPSNRIYTTNRSTGRSFSQISKKVFSISETRIDVSPETSQKASSEQVLALLN
ncbi:MAG: hypothetical protein ACI9BD_001032 [Candidatus Marinamargulisbacteria bacterium]